MLLNNYNLTLSPDDEKSVIGYLGSEIKEQIPQLISEHVFRSEK